MIRSAPDISKGDARRVILEYARARVYVMYHSVTSSDLKYFMIDLYHVYYGITLQHPRWCHDVGFLEYTTDSHGSKEILDIMGKDLEWLLQASHGDFWNQVSECECECECVCVCVCVCVYILCS